MQKKLTKYSVLIIFFSDFFDAKGKHCKKENAVSWSCPDYDADTWEEIPYLTANVAEPRFIKEDSYDR